MRHLIRLFTVLLAALLAAPDAFAQGATVTGKVTAEGGAPVPFASVVLTGMGLGGSTREDGVYSISVPAARATGQTVVLAVRAIGY